MRRPVEAINAAIHELSLKENDYTLERVVDLAEEKLGDDAEYYRRYFLRDNLSRKASDALRRHHESTTLAKRQLELLGGMPERRVAVREGEGAPIYKLFGALKWRQLMALREEQLAKAEKVPRNPLLAAIDRLEPIMTKDQNLTVEEAAQRLPDNPDDH